MNVAKRIIRRKRQIGHIAVAMTGSMIGGIPETPETLDYRAEHNITSDVEVIPIQKINEAYLRLGKNDVKYRFVIEMASLKNA